MVSLIIISCQWWRDITRESTFQRIHSYIVVIGLRWRIILFITSEVPFFVSFLSPSHYRLSPNIEMGVSWLPLGVQPFNPWRVPLLDTPILLSSGIRVIWFHKSIEKNNHNQAAKSFLITIILGIYSTVLQAIEYYKTRFKISYFTYGSHFFLLQALMAYMRAWNIIPIRMNLYLRGLNLK